MTIHKSTSISVEELGTLSSNAFHIDWNNPIEHQDGSVRRFKVTIDDGSGRGPRTPVIKLRNMKVDHDISAHSLGLSDDRALVNYRLDDNLLSRGIRWLNDRYNESFNSARQSEPILEGVIPWIGPVMTTYSTNLITGESTQYDDCMFIIPFYPDGSPRVDIRDYTQKIEREDGQVALAPLTITMSDSSECPITRDNVHQVIGRNSIIDGIFTAKYVCVYDDGTVYYPWVFRVMIVDP